MLGERMAAVCAGLSIYCVTPQAEQGARVKMEVKAMTVVQVLCTLK